MNLVTWIRSFFVRKQPIRLEWLKPDPRYNWRSNDPDCPIFDPDPAVDIAMILDDD